MKRWHVEIVYRGENGPIDVHHDVEELREVEALVERGPHWDTIDRITTTLQRPANPAWPCLTVEEAEKL